MTNESIPLSQIDWSKSHNGLMLCTYEQTKEYMPEVLPVVDKVLPFLEYSIDQYVIDVKVHMLMPGEYPCIPNWHCDFIPRDENYKKLPEKITGDAMYLWVSGEPRTEFEKPEDIVVLPENWIKFTQKDLHRGVISKVHTWRCFIRIIPKWFIHPTTINIGTIRRHTQVYIEDPNKFRW